MASFRSFQRWTTAALRAARRDYINNILVESLETKDNKPFWRYIKSQRQEFCVAPLKADGQVHPDASKKAGILNQQFTSVFTSGDEDDFSGTVLEGPSILPIGSRRAWSGQNASEPRCEEGKWPWWTPLPPAQGTRKWTGPDIHWRLPVLARHRRTTICMEDCKRGPNLQKRIRLWGNKLPPCKPHLHPM